MSMGNYFGNKSNRLQLYQGEIISCYRKYLNNHDRKSCFMHGILKYMSHNGSIENIEYWTKQTDLNIGDTVTFNFSDDKTALNPYANTVIKYNFNSEMKQENDKNNKHKYKHKMKQSSSVRLICISDTHNSHSELTQELNDIYESESDILIHCGDMTDSGSISELKAVDEWFGKLPYKHIIITAGNMDGIGLDKNKYKYKTNNNYNNYNSNNLFDNDDDTNITNMYDSDNEEEIRGESIFKNAIYLQHKPYYLKDYNLRFFGSPYSMRFVGGFQVNNNKQAEILWKEIPTKTDILICHGPPYNILDLTSRGKHTGDEILYKHIINRIKPKVVCFGHMHSSYGYKQYKGIHFYNCAQNNSLNRHHSNSTSYSYSYYRSNKKNNNVKKEIPHIINFSQLS